jgi:hypothetical protein
MAPTPIPTTTHRGLLRDNYMNALEFDGKVKGTLFLHTQDSA